MRKTKQALLLLLTASFFLLAANDAFAQDQSVLKFRSGAGPGPVPECGPGNSTINQGLREDFGLIIKEGGIGWEGRTTGFNGKTAIAENVDCDTRKAIYRSYARPSKSESFLRNLKPRFPFSFECYAVPGYDESKGLVRWIDRIQFVNCSNVSNSFATYSYLVVHETGHLVAHRNSRLYQSFPFGSLQRRDPGCYNLNNGGVMKTYPITPNDPKSESFAEALTLYVYNTKITTYLLAQSIYNFKRDCDDTYRWMKANAYGNYEFN